MLSFAPAWALCFGHGFWGNTRRIILDFRKRLEFDPQWCSFWAATRRLVGWLVCWRCYSRDRCLAPNC